MICTNLFPFAPEGALLFQDAEVRGLNPCVPSGDFNTSVMSLPVNHHPPPRPADLSPGPPSPRVRKWMYHLLSKHSLNTHCGPGPGLGTVGRERTKLASRPEQLTV